MSDRPTHVCMVVMARYPNDGRVRREAEALRNAGITVDVLCLRGEGESRVEHFDGITAHRIMRERDKEDMVGYLLLSTTFTVWSTIRLLLRSTRTRYDLIHVHNMPDYLVFSGIFHKLRGRPVVLDLHDLSVELLGSKWTGRRGKVLRPLVAAVERLSCRFATHLISTSPGFEERLVERGNRRDKITMVLNTANSTAFPPDPDRRFEVLDDQVRLLYHGTVAERFGLVMALDALALVRKRIPGATLAVYGKYDPSCRSAMEDRIGALALDDAVTLDGWKSFEEIRDIIGHSDIGIVPYLRNDFMQLALSTKSFEYASSGLPVVAAELAPISSVFDDQAIAFFEPDDPQSMADAIVGLCLDPQRRQRMACGAGEAVASISGEVMAERYVTLVRRLTNGDDA